MADSQPSEISQPKPRSNSISHASESSQTAAEFIKEQLHLEAEAREALPYQFDTCTRDLGAIRQSLFSCLTCSPPPVDPSELYTPAGVCYSCSISCHGEHTLVELFNKRNFVCDCGTTRLSETSPCTLRMNATTGQKGDVAGEQPAQENRYNQNFRNRFCGCGEEYDPHQEKGTMFQCLGLGTVEDGGCGEDWWHPECLVGLSREEWKDSLEKRKATEKPADDTTPKKAANGIHREISFSRSEENINGPEESRRPSVLTAIAANNGVDGNDIAADGEEDEDDDPLPPGFPAEDNFEYLICYKCVEAHPWIKQYAGRTGFLPPLYHDAALNATHTKETSTTLATEPTNGESRKRKADDSDDANTTDPTNTSLLPPLVPPKRQKSEEPLSTLSSIPETTSLPITPKKPTPDPTACKLTSPPTTSLSSTPFTLFLLDTFRDSLCRCPTHFPLLTPFPQLLEEEDTYEPPVSEDGNEAPGSAGTNSIYDRGEAAFSNMDRVRAIQGAMAYAHLKDGLKSFLQPFAESGTAVGAEDIKAYFEKLRGDEKGIAEAKGGAAEQDGGDGDGDGGEGSNGRKEQSGY
ncbi:putative zinc finger in N-recognin-domain-containing protein [Dendryphion nanum]|uniref:Zinc finger in N-recognin-domain-containing protein n=1 Tax=Dendryphion nanum TaxID=256645 RepID=A0A9P9IFJ1_9PLEO|nr:putative zinc finger in N-recognin-domain-containing protein [Dendryphion nanum]